MIANEQNTVYAGIQVNPPVFLEMRDDPNKDYIAVNTHEPFALVPAATNDSNNQAAGYPANVPPIPAIDSLPGIPGMPDMPGFSPDMDFTKSLSIKAIIYSKSGNNIAILSDGQNEIAASAGQETGWGRVEAINVDSVIIGQEKITARQLV
jgi:hypothetical protein